MSLYTDTIRRYALDDRFAGTLVDADGVGEVGLAAGEAGRRLAVRFALRLRAGRANAVRFQVFGCGFTVAACVAAAELAEGASLEEIAGLTPAAVDARLGGLPAERGYCAQLATDALRAAAASAGRNGMTETVTAATHEAGDVARLDPLDPLYRMLLARPKPRGIAEADRVLFAGLLAIACRDSRDPAAALGLGAGEFDALRTMVFPGLAAGALAGRGSGQPPAPADDLRDLLLGYLPAAATLLAPFLARALAARATCPGHLWVATGLQERRELTAAIRRHLPALAEANSGQMRWKRFFFRQLCTQSGGTLCRSPECGTCSDRELCFAPTET